jgi:hypothetical protein
MSTLIATELPEGRGFDGEAFPQWNAGGIPKQRVSFLQDAGPLAAESSFASMTSSFVDLEYSKQQQPPSRDSFTAVGSPFSSQQPLSRGSFSTAGDPFSSGRTGVKHVDLKGRGFTQLPAFGREAGVMSIVLSDNSIGQLESAPVDLPESLQVCWTAFYVCGPLLIKLRFQNGFVTRSVRFNNWVEAVSDWGSWTVFRDCPWTQCHLPLLRKVTILHVYLLKLQVYCTKET